MYCSDNNASTRPARTATLMSPHAQPSSATVSAGPLAAAAPAAAAVAAAAPTQVRAAASPDAAAASPFVGEAGRAARGASLRALRASTGTDDELETCYDALNDFIRLTSMIESLHLPKRHIMIHLMRRMKWLGNARLCGNLVDEALNKT